MRARTLVAVISMAVLVSGWPASAQKTPQDVVQQATQEVANRIAQAAAQQDAPNIGPQTAPTVAPVPRPSAPAAPTGARSAIAGQPAPPPFTLQYDGHIVVRADRSAAETFTKRLKILTPGAVATASQQQFNYVAEMENLEVAEAFTEKSDGTKVPVGATNIITRDGASGLPATYMRDLKQRTIIFQNVEVGDTLVMTTTKETRQSLFPGQFFYSGVFARNAPTTAARVIVEAPDDFDLQVRAVGAALHDSIEEASGIRRHVVTLTPQPYLPAEIRAVSPVDEDPLLLVSTFRSYREMGLAYAAAALAKAEVTPQIAALADDITKGIDDRRQQAVAIDTWMKKNIRYVAVYLSVGRVVPNDAATVLMNRYGDCKDKATLMAALLAAKGIASEAVLINLGNAYTLPEPPTMAVLNHVILYLPEFDLYDDPTARNAAFGVLAAETYDKPVVRVGANGAVLAHTPAMRPQDHIAHSHTTIKIAADGSITGETEETNTGIFATTLRVAAGNIQNLGDAAAQRMLQAFNTPGTGRYDLGNAADTTDPVISKSQFTLTTPFKAPAAGERTNIPFGLPQTVRPGNFLLGTRLEGRKTAFVCFAGRRIEDIEAIFDPSLPMPAPLMGRTIENTAFTYEANFKIEGRTLKMHRDFVSTVSGQVCPAELETRIAGDMNTVRVNVNSGYGFAAAQAQTIELKRAVASEGMLRLDFIYSLNPDCTSIGFATVRILEQPTHGKITVENGTGFSNFPQQNLRFECNKRRSDGVVLTYKPEGGFTGPDSINIDAIYASGTSQKRHYNIEVR
jgi:hypothetical protein